MSSSTDDGAIQCPPRGTAGVMTGLARSAAVGCTPSRGRAGDSRSTEYNPMSHESVTAYLDACRRSDAAASHFRDLARIVSGVAKCLSGQARMQPYPPGMGPFSPGIDRIEVEPPAETVWFDWPQWPTTEQLKRADRVNPHALTFVNATGPQQAALAHRGLIRWHSAMWVGRLGGEVDGCRRINGSTTECDGGVA